MEPELGGTLLAGPLLNLYVKQRAELLTAEGCDVRTALLALAALVIAGGDQESTPEASFAAALPKCQAATNEDLLDIVNRQDHVLRDLGYIAAAVCFRLQSEYRREH